MSGTSPEYHRAWYAKNRVRRRQQINAYKIRRKAEMTAIVRAYKLRTGCVDCGEMDPIVLDLDHRDRMQKLYNVSYILLRQLSNEVLIAELEKCDVRCANCHRRKTFHMQEHRSIAGRVPPPWNTSK